MKILKIEDKIGFYLNKYDEYKNIREINKEDIFTIMNKIYESDNLEELYDDFIENETVINNPAEKIIYENLIKHIKQFIITIPEIKEHVVETFKDFTE